MMGSLGVARTSHSGNSKSSTRRLLRCGAVAVCLALVPVDGAKLISMQGYSMQGYALADTAVGEGCAETASVSEVESLDPLLMTPISRRAAASSAEPSVSFSRRSRGPKDKFDLDGDGKVDISVPTAKCNESVFKPTICWNEVPKDIQYRPSYEQCGGKAAILLGGKFSSSYSVVLRDKLNRDRFPPCVQSGSNFNGCSYSECDTFGLNRCSAFKCQRTLRTRNGRKRVKICCLGASGSSTTLSKATRLTIKLRDDPTSSDDPLVRVALKKNNPKLKLN